MAASLWKEDHRGPAILHGDRIITDRQMCELLTGKLVQRDDPLTGRPVDWIWNRNYGCNTPQASQHLLLFRSGAAGYCDLSNDGGTGNFGGFRSSCTNNLIAAGGVLSVPEYTRTCTCDYQNQTSLALVHMPEVEVWTEFPLADDKDVRHLALNLGAPGFRRADDGTLWLNYFRGCASRVRRAGLLLPPFIRRSRRRQAELGGGLGLSRHPPADDQSRAQGTGVLHGAAAFLRSR